MTDIELVIKIDKDIVQGIIDGENDVPRNIVRAFQATIADAIKNGVLLPKKHGRLIDADYEVSSDGRTVNSVCGYLAPTIIEADIKKIRKGTPLEENDSGYNCENWIP